MDPWDAYIVKRAIARLEPDPARFLFGLCTRSEGESVENVAERLGYSTDSAKNYARTVYSALQLKGKSRAITPEICQLFFEVAGVGPGEEPDWNRWPPPEPERPPSTVVLMPAAEAPQPEQLDIANDRPFWRRSFSRRQQFFGAAIAVAGLVFIAFLIFGNGDEPPGGDSPTADGTAPGGIGQVTPGDSPTEETQPQETPAPSPVVLPTATNTRQPTETPTKMLTPSITPTPTDTPTPTSTATPTVTPTPTNTPTPSATPLSVASSWANDRVALSIAGHEFNAFDVKGVIGYRFAALFTFRYENVSGETISLRFNGENFRLIDDSGVSYVCRASIGGHYQEQEQMTLNVPSGGGIEFNIGCGRDEVIGQGVLSAYLITTAFSSLGDSRWYIEVPG